MPETPLDPARHSRIVTEAVRRGRRRSQRRRLGAWAGAAVAGMVFVAAIGIAVTRNSPTDKVEIVSPSSVPSTGAARTSKSTSRPATTAATTPSNPPGSASPQFFQLVSPDHAWIASDSPRLAVYRTSNGGREWSDVTPPLHGIRRVNNTLSGFHAADFNHAIVAVPTAANSSSVTLYATSDGGVHWAATTIDGYDVQSFSFLDALHGWDESSLGAAMGTNPVNVLRTADGGVHWEVMSRGDDFGTPGSSGALSSGCDKSGIGFENAVTGFAAASCVNGIYFEVTHDSGRTWQDQPLPLPPGVTLAQVHADTYVQETGPPAFDGLRGAGTMVGTIGAGQKFTQHWWVYFTTDGGSHWSLADPPMPNATWAIVIDATHWWAGNAETFASTADAGAHWTAVGPNVRLDFAGQLSNQPVAQFTSPLSGWALSDSPSGSGGLIRTADGGRTWQLVPLPRSTPSS